MATNSSNTTIAAEVGWQAAPLTRGTASILWNCISVILLITWTSFHSSVGISRTQRVVITITATLVSELSALVAARDMLFSYRLRHAFKHYVGRPGWKDGWTLEKSFLVVKGGIRAGPHHDYLSNHSNFAQSINMIANKIIDPETFIRLALTDSIQYEDFPTTEDINDKSNADWFSKIATLIQLSWAVVSMVCRLSNHCTISVMEIIILDWIMFGLFATLLWWKCPQNIKTPYTIPVQYHRMPVDRSPFDHDTHAAMGALHEHVINYHNFMADEDGFDNLPFGHFSLVTIVLTGMQCLIHFLFWGAYQWHSAQSKTAWMVFTSFFTVSELVLFFADPHMRYDWSDESIFKTYIRPLLLEPPRSCVEENRNGGRWLALARGMGIYNPTDLKPWRCASQQTWHDYDLKLVVAAVFVAFICQAGKLIIALMAFTRAPSGIYTVPRVWVLEALVHVGG